MKYGHIKSQKVIIDEFQKQISVQGSVTGASVKAYNITNRKLAKEAIRISDEMFFKAFNLGPNAISITRMSDGIIIECNDYAFDLLGYKRDEVTGKSTSELDIWADITDRKDFVLSISAKGFVKNKEYKFQKKDETIVFVDLSATLITLNDQTCILASFIDITERKKTEEALKASERRFRAVFDNSLDAILLALPDGNVISSNKAAEEMFAMKESEIITKKLEELLVPDKNAKEAMDTIRITGKMHSELLFRRRDGSEFFGEVTSNLFTDTDGTKKFSMIIRDISPRKESERAVHQSEIALKLSEERFRYALHNAPVSVAMQDLDLKYVWAYNQKTIKPEEIIGHTDEDIFNPAEAEIFTAIKKNIISEKVSKHGDFCIERPSGKKHFSIYWDPVFDDNGTIKGIVSATLDITTLKSAQDDLKKLNRILTAVNSSRQRMIYSKAEADYLRQVCDVFIEECGYRMIWIGYLENDEMGSVTPVCFSGIDDGYISNLKIAVNDPIRGNGPTGVSIRTKKPAFCKNMQTDPAFLPWREEALKRGINSSVVLPLISSGKVFGVINVYSEDPDPFTSEEVNLLMDLASDLSYGIMAIRSNMEARKATDKLNLALDNGGIGTWELNLQTSILTFDERMSNILGLEKYKGSTTWDSFEALLEEDNVAHIRKSIEDAVQKETPLSTIFRLKTSNGQIRYIKSNALFEKDNSDRIIKLVGVSYDISEMQKATEKTLIKVNEELLRSNKELEQFAYVASHDLQEPLRLVSSFTQLLAMQYGDKLDENAKEYIQFAQDGARRMYNLINDILAFSRIQTRGKEFAKVNMMKVITRVLQTLEISIKETKSEITFDTLPEIHADINQINQLMLNLINNAMKFCNTTPSIHISCSVAESFYTFSVSDNGIGIESQYFEKIFQVFKRLNAVDKYPGTGIGLAICKRIVERHGGRIWLESEPGKGTTFFFTLKRMNEENT